MGRQHTEFREEEEKEEDEEGRCSPHSPAQSGPSRCPSPRSFPPQRMDVRRWRNGWRRWEGWLRVDRQRARKGREDEKGGFCLVISIRSLPSGAVVRWLAGRPEGPTACAGPPTRRRSGPGCRLGCSGRSSWRLPGRRPPRFHL